MNRTLAYAIPNLFTIGSLIAALFALHQAAHNVFHHACFLITLSIILDGFDGKMARILNSTSRLGAQADSLADFVAFGVVPGFLAWQYGLHYFGFFGFLVFVLYVLCGGFRLARFNVMSEKSAKKEEFVGLPIPAAAGVVASFILFKELAIPGVEMKMMLLFILPLMSYLMVSKTPYIAVNKAKIKKKYYGFLGAFVVGFLFLAIKYFPWVYLISAWIYVFYGLFNQGRLIKVKLHAKPKRVSKN